MFVIKMRKCTDGTWGNWFQIWCSEDGADSAAYLRQCSINEHRGAEFSMTFNPIL